MSAGSRDSGSGKVRRRLGFAAVFAFVAVAFLVDLNLTQNASPDYTPSPCSSLDDDSVNELECEQDFEAASNERREREQQLGDDLDDRSWVYLIVLALGFLLVADRSIRKEGQEERDVAADLGVIGVLLLLLIVLIAQQTSTGWQGVRLPPAGRLALVSLVLMSAAAVGAAVGQSRVATRLPALADPASPPPGIAHPSSLRPPKGPWYPVARIGIGLTCATVLLALTQIPEAPGCSDVPTWREVVVWIIAGLAIGAVACGLAGLLVRRWFVALICLTVAPTAFFIAALTNSCLS